MVLQNLFASKRKPNTCYAWSNFEQEKNNKDISAFGGVPLCRLVLLHHLLSISSFQIQIRVWGSAVLMVPCLHLQDPGSMDLLKPENEPI